MEEKSNGSEDFLNIHGTVHFDLWQAWGRVFSSKMYSSPAEQDPRLAWTRTQTMQFLLPDTTHRIIMMRAAGHHPLAWHKPMGTFHLHEWWVAEVCTYGLLPACATSALVPHAWPLLFENTVIQRTAWHLGGLRIFIPAKRVLLLHRVPCTKIKYTVYNEGSYHQACSALQIWFSMHG